MLWRDTFTVKDSRTYKKIWLECIRIHCTSVHACCSPQRSSCLSWRKRHVCDAMKRNREMIATRKQIQDSWLEPPMLYMFHRAIYDQLAYHLSIPTALSISTVKSTRWRHMHFLAQLMRPGIGKNMSYTVGDFATSKNAFFRKRCFIDCSYTATTCMYFTKKWLPLLWNSCPHLSITPT